MDQKRPNRNKRRDVSTSDTGMPVLPQSERAHAGKRRVRPVRWLLRRAQVLLIRLGLHTVRVCLQLLLPVCYAFVRLGQSLRKLPGILAILLRDLRRILLQPLHLHSLHTGEIEKDLRAAKKHGGRRYRAAVFRSFGRYLLGERGLLITLFNYAAPVAAVTFLVGVVSHGVNLEYGLRVDYNGVDLGVIASEGEFDLAAQEVQKRVANTKDGFSIVYTPKYALTVVDSAADYVSSSDLVNLMLTNSNANLVEAYGLYIDGNFIAAVKEKDSIEKALQERLSAYKTTATAKEVGYKNEIVFQNGMYLDSSLMETAALQAQLLDSKEYAAVYTAVEGDTPLLIAKRFSMALDALYALNPDLKKNCKPGVAVNVVKTSSYLPIQYIEEVNLTSYVPYETVQIETSAVNEGTTEVLVRGVQGERSNLVQIVYEDGTEAYRNTLRSTMVKEPVTEQVGVGTYSASPDSAATVLKGSGQFSWPVNGGYVSDPFISNRNHKGLDIAAPSGTEVYAAADGVVTSAGWNSGGYGYLITVEHEKGFETFYGHCSMIWTYPGQKVSRGQLIGSVGSTGNSTGNHLHFEVRSNGICMDPAAFLRVNAE